MPCHAMTGHDMPCHAMPCHDLLPCQGLKRLVTKSQQYYPTDPSRMVEYIKADIRPQNVQKTTELE
jgi:hypothetical protein